MAKTQSTGGKCPKCPKRFPHTKAGAKAFQKHYANTHHTSKAKKIDKKRNWKIPGFAKR